MNKKNARSGQGLIEYLLVISVVVLATVVAFVTFYNVGVQQTENSVTNSITSAAS